MFKENAFSYTRNCYRGFADLQGTYHVLGTLVFLWGKAPFMFLHSGISQNVYILSKKTSGFDKNMQYLMLVRVKVCRTMQFYTILRFFLVLVYFRFTFHFVVEA